MAAVINQQVTWFGKRGSYNFFVLGLNTTWKDVPGIYIFTSLTPHGWRPIYIGQCASFRDRLTTAHHKLECIKRNGATHVHAMVLQGAEAARLAVEEDLLARYSTSCNEMLN